MLERLENLENNLAPLLEDFKTFIRKIRPYI